MRALPDSPAPRRTASVSRPALWAGPFGGVDPPERRAASWSYSSNHNPLGNCISAEPETDSGPDSTRTRFLIAPRRTVPVSHKLDRLRRRPEELVIFACLRLAPLRGGRHQLTLSFPRLPGIIPVALSAGFSCRRTATVLSRNGKEMRPNPRNVTGLFLPSYSPAARRSFALATVNNLCPRGCPQVVHIPSPVQTCGREFGRGGGGLSVGAAGSSITNVEPRPTVLSQDTQP